jgi:cytochrome c peroxidase
MPVYAMNSCTSFSGRSRSSLVCLYTFGLCLLLAFLSSCTPSTEPVSPADNAVIKAPPLFPAVPVPADNPATVAKIALGRKLFYEPRLSFDGTISCASCHKQEFAFTDGGFPVSRGVGGEVGIRNTPTIVNTAYLHSLAMDGLSVSLEQQSLRAFLNPLEMRSDTAVVSRFLQQDTLYAHLFADSFHDAQPATAHNAVRAIATFMRSVLSGNSRYDRFVQGEKTALSASEQRGKELFFSEKTRCASCHKAPEFTDGEFHNTGLSMHYFDKGRYYATYKDTDVGKFKTPSLRNIAVTAPYMHDGSVRTLEDLLEHYNKGGMPNLNRDTLMRPLTLTKQEKADILDFLHALTDDQMLNNPAFAKP